MQSRGGWPGRVSAATVRRAAYSAVAAAVISSAVASQAAAAQPTKGARYEYDSVRTITSANFRVSRSGKALTDLTLMMWLRCSNGRESAAIFFGFAQERPARLPIARDGTFSGTFAVEQESLQSFSVSEEYWLSGRFIRRGKAARLVVRSRHVGEGGTVCDSSDRRVTARRVARRSKWPS